MSVNRWPLAHKSARLTLLTVPLLALGGCEWFTDFKRQPHVVTWESWRADSLGVRGAPQGSIPLDGTAVPSWTVSYSPTIATLDSMSGIQNPVPITEASLTNGRKYFQINCAVCHGSNADGQTPNGRYGIIPIPLIGDVTKNRTDGYIFGMIRNGRNTMPSYNRIEERDRWDLINYLRAIQSGGAAAAGAPLGRPGETGTQLPGASITAPTVPAPFVKPVLP